MLTGVLVVDEAVLAILESSASIDDWCCCFARSPQDCLRKSRPDWVIDPIGCQSNHNRLVL